MKDIIIGSNSYLGINLVDYLDNSKLILFSSKNQVHFINAECYSLNLYKEYISREYNNINRVFVLSKPDYGVQLNSLSTKFYENLLKTLKTIISCNQRITIHFMSTALVYNSDKNVLIDLTIKPKPVSKYEIEKLLFEEKLKSLQKINDNLSLQIHRLPLLIGGNLREYDKKNQILYRFNYLLNKGIYWKFTDSNLEYGTSWLDVTDFIKWMIKENFNMRYQVWLPSSGKIKYSEFMRIYEKRQVLKRPIAYWNVPQSYLFLNNTTSIPQKSFSDTFNP